MLIDSAADLVEAMGWQTERPKPQQIELFIELTAEQQALLDLLRQQEDGIHQNTLLLEMKMSFSSLMSLLFDMEMQGLVKALPGGFYRAVI